MYNAHALIVFPLSLLKQLLACWVYVCMYACMCVRVYVFLLAPSLPSHSYTDTHQTGGEFYLHAVIRVGPSNTSSLFSCLYMCVRKNGDTLKVTKRRGEVYTYTHTHIHTYTHSPSHLLSPPSSGRSREVEAVHKHTHIHTHKTYTNTHSPSLLLSPPLPGRLRPMPFSFSPPPSFGSFGKTFGGLSGSL